ncbi:hypothetical protein pdam_00014815 [Pocillopora damicornis]|uniref:Mutator-like transposase domain-containing protein n=1 Tax=Pocillopora damicornis TaxID=46731 RepID=A0A3M6UKF6_POCDA|nr:hypothetical protein pdam_00014815 [Pocillopora damicornis]
MTGCSMAFGNWMINLHTNSAVSSKLKTSPNLSWWNITAEKKYGLASVFSVTCAVCGTENVVKTSSEHRSSQRGPISHDDNSRAALQCLHTEIVTFKSRENKIGHAVEQVTKKSCKTAMSEERNAAIKKGVKADDRGCINIPCSYDMAWQKQGKGDDDSIPAAHIKEKVPYPVEKWTDTVYAKGSLTTRLYNLSQRGTFLSYCMEDSPPVNMPSSSLAN